MFPPSQNGKKKDFQQFLFYVTAILKSISNSNGSHFEMKVTWHQWKHTWIHVLRIRPTHIAHTQIMWTNTVHAHTYRQKLTQIKKNNTKKVSPPPHRPVQLQICGSQHKGLNLTLFYDTLSMQVLSTHWPMLPMYVRLMSSSFPSTGSYGCLNPALGHDGSAS